MLVVDRDSDDHDHDHDDEDDVSSEKVSTMRLQGQQRRQYRRRARSSSLHYICAILLSTFLYMQVQVHAWIPPRPGTEVADQWESVGAMRQRLGIAFNYTPSLLHPEICRHMTEDECRQGDQDLKTHSRRHRALQQQQQLSQSQQTPNVRGHNPNLGTFKVLVLLVQFSDHTGRPMIDKTDVELMWNTLIPEWFDENSHGNYEIEAVVVDWVVSDNTEQYYSFDRSGITVDFQKAAYPALDALDNTEGWDWSIFDVDQDGRLDSVVITHSGYGAETVSTDEYDTEYTQRIWAHAFAFSGSVAWTSKDGSVSMSGYTVASAFDSDKDTTPAKIGLTVHEYMHTFDIIDLYDTTDPSLGAGIGGFDIMSSPYGPNNNADFPGHLSVWSKNEVDWAVPTEITSDGIYTLQPLETTSDGYRITLGSNAENKTEYLLLENRQKLEFDLYLYGAGLAIYHVDDAMDGQKLRGFPGQVDEEGVAWPENGRHYEVAMLQADGQYALEEALDRGGTGDLWSPGQVLGPGKSNTKHPNTDRYQGGDIRETGITVTVLEADNELEVKFEVSGLGEGDDGDGGANTTTTTDSPTFAPTLSPTTKATPNPTSAPTDDSSTLAPTLSPTTKATPNLTSAPTDDSSTLTPTLSPTTNATPNLTLAPTNRPASNVFDQATVPPIVNNTQSVDDGPTLVLANPTNITVSKPANATTDMNTQPANSGDRLDPPTAEPSMEEQAIPDVLFPDSGDAGIIATDAEATTLVPTPPVPAEAPVVAAVDLSTSSTEAASNETSGSQWQGEMSEQTSSATYFSRRPCWTIIATSLGLAAFRHAVPL